MMTAPSIGDRDLPSPPMHHNAVSNPKHSPSWLAMVVVVVLLALGVLLGLVPRWIGA